MLQQPRKQNNFMETMNQNVLTNALHGLYIGAQGSDHNDDGDENIGDEKESGLNNWYLSGLQTVKLRSPSDYENMSEMESDVDGSELSDFNDGVVQYESEEDGVKPFSETEDEEDNKVIGGGGVSDSGQESDHEFSGGERTVIERTVIEVNNEVSSFYILN